jgi:hypothetical protein
MGVKQDAAAAPAEMARISRPGRTRLSGSYGDFAGFWIGSCNGLVGGPRVTPPPCLRLLEPVALAVQLQNMDMMREAIEKRASETLATEDARPFLKRKIRRDDGRATFVTLAEYFKQKHVLNAGPSQSSTSTTALRSPLRPRRLAPRSPLRPLQPPGVAQCCASLTPAIHYMPGTMSSKF